MATIQLQSPHHTEPLSVEVVVENDVSIVRWEQQEYALELHWESANSGWARDIKTGAVTPFYLLKEADQIQLWIKGQVYRYTIPSLQSQRQRAKGGSTLESSGEIKAPMPGSILKILVKSGDSVELHTPLVIMESMKMEMTLSAPITGTIKTLYCEVGQLVEMNAILIKMDAAKE